jgi:LacI family transcriptional regulator
MSAVGIKQVAQRAGVAIGTVSNVLNRPKLVAEPTRQRVIDAIADLGYVRNESARALRSGVSRTIALVVLDAANPFFADVASGVEPIVSSLGSLLMVCDTGGDPERERRYLKQLEEQRVQGILITPTTDDCRAIVQLAQRGTPVVLVDSGTLRHKSCAVSVDDVLGGSMAVSHLIETGRRRILLAGGHAGVRQVRERRNGAQQAALEHAGVTINTVDSQTLGTAAGREIGRHIAHLPVDQRPTGVFCMNDLVALGVMQQLSLEGVGVPRDVGVIGYDDIEFAQFAMTPLSSLRQPRAELGRTAAELLDAELTGGTAHRHRQVVFQPELIVRASTD